jgi:hypothetical protein
MLVGNTARRGPRYNQRMERTRVAPVQGPKCARKSLAHFGPGKHRQRAVHLGRYADVRQRFGND